MTSLSTTNTGKNFNSFATWGKRRLVNNAVLKRRPVVFAKTFCLIVLALLAVSLTYQHTFASTEADRNLISAASLGDIARVKDSLNSGANVNIKDDNGQTPLYLAANGGYTSVVALLLDRGGDAGATTSAGATPLMVAALRNYTDIVKLLIARKASVDFAAHNGSTALMWAAVGGHPEIIKLLLDSGAQVNKKTVEGFTALHTAISSDRKEAVKLLLEKGADPNSVAGKDQKTPLIFGVEKGSDDIVGLLISGGANADLKDNYGKSALDYASGTAKIAIAKRILPVSKEIRPETADILIRNAIETGDNDIIKAVLAKKPAIPEPDRKNALERAINSNRIEIIKLLLSQWDDPGLVKMALQMACWQSNPELVKLILTTRGNLDPAILYELIESWDFRPIEQEKDNALKLCRIEIARAVLGHSSVDIRHPKVGKALIREINHEDKEAVRILLDRGADVNFGKGEALYIAVVKKDAHLSKTLLDRGADVNAQDGKILLQAIEGKNTDLVQMLLDRGANPNDTKGNIIAKAIQLNDINLLRKLLDKGGSPQGTGVDHSPLELACRKDNLAMVQLLLAKGADVNKNLCGEKALKAALNKCSVDMAKAILDARLNLDNMVEEQTMAGKKNLPLRVRMIKWLEFSMCRKKMFELLEPYGVRPK